MNRRVVLNGIWQPFASVGRPSAIKVGIAAPGIFVHRNAGRRPGWVAVLKSEQTR